MENDLSRFSDRQLLERTLQELGMVGRMLKTYLVHEQLYQVVDQAAWGQNEGGVYLSLFNSRANFRICNVYSENFGKLPADLAAYAPTEVGHEVATDRKRAADKGHIFDIPKMGITRYRLNPDDEKDKWRFAEVLWVSGKRPETVPPPAPVERQVKQPAKQPAKRQAQQSGAEPHDDGIAFENLEQALRWAVTLGAYPSADEARVAYYAVKEQAVATTAQAAYAAWARHVNEGLRFQKRRAASAEGSAA